jgi:hypothetical protein
VILLGPAVQNCSERTVILQQLKDQWSKLTFLRRYGRRDQQSRTLAQESQLL